jgi:hypothetical protein
MMAGRPNGNMAFRRGGWCRQGNIQRHSAFIRLFFGSAGKGGIMGVVVGPVLARPGGFAFDTWTVADGLNPGYVYRRIGDTYYARDAAINSVANDRAPIDGWQRPASVRACDTLEQFISELIEHGGLLKDSVLRVLCSLQAA